MATVLQKRFPSGGVGFLELCDLSKFARKLISGLWYQAIGKLAVDVFISIEDQQVIIRPHTLICRSAIMSAEFFEVKTNADYNDWLFTLGGGDPDLRERALQKGWEEVEDE